ncbi:MAG TPA: peroxiredoxin [Gammaproteobacteria bacterium]|jgi:peroxiredoxin Q/BCP|nr:peroxiredoxin [Gammaproteobacteria bacterium]HIK76430.1 peroxiredoxin [Gammaproteobacteria bacterium]
MAKVSLGKAIPDFKGKITNDLIIKFSDYKGQNIVIYFYPKDNTPGCTKEGEDFRDYFEDFKKNNTIILGVSRDSVASHDKFTCKYNFPFKLISDEDEKVCKLFDVIKEKNMYGRKYMGIERSTFLINHKGTLVNEWRKVKVKGHVEQVLGALNDL